MIPSFNISGGLEEHISGSHTMGFISFASRKYHSLQAGLDEIGLEESRLDHSSTSL